MELAGIGLPEDFEEEDREAAITGLQNRAEKVSPVLHLDHTAAGHYASLLRPHAFRVGARPGHGMLEHYWWFQTTAWHSRAQAMVSGVIGLLLQPMLAVQVKPGDLFIYISEPEQDVWGRVKEALERGAAAIMSSELFEADDDLEVPVLLVPDCLQAQQQLGAAFYDMPSLKMNTVAVAGVL